MPFDDDDATSHLPKGTARYIDRLFRLQRYENLDPVIKICRNGLQMMAFPELADGKSTEHRLETPDGLRYNLFRYAKFEELIFHENDGLLVRLSYHCPRILRGRAMGKSSVLEKGMMVALLVMHEDSPEVNVVFFEVHLRESTVSSPYASTPRVC